MTLLALVLGLLIGSLPTADLLSRARGVDLRSGGSGNPGARNALEVGGKALAGAVLVVELAKGVGAVSLGRWLSGDAGGALAGITATFGNVYNPWFNFKGGKGLGISGGIILAAWPAMFVAAVAVLGTGILALRRSGPASLATFVVYVAGATIGLFVNLSGGWAMTSGTWLFVLALGSVAVMTPKHLADTIRPADLPRFP